MINDMKELNEIVTVQFSQTMLEYFVEAWNDNKVRSKNGDIITIEIDKNKWNGHAVLTMMSYTPTVEEMGCSKCYKVNVSEEINKLDCHCSSQACFICREKSE